MKLIRQAWIDVALFAGGLVLAWWSQWQTGDLVWSLWLASLVIGYAMICKGAFAPAVLHLREGKTLQAVMSVFSALATLAFFTVHFGLFHAVQAVILNKLFPLGIVFNLPDFAVLKLVVESYWWFLPLALLSEREQFHLPTMPLEPPPTSVKSADIDARKARQQYGTLLLWMPYLNVIRMHLLMFALAGLAHWHLDGAYSYVLVYVVFFMPWRALASLRGADKQAAT